MVANGNSVTGLESSKVQELFGYLLCHRDRPLPRERLADALWNHLHGNQSRKYLRQALWHLQSALNEVYQCEHLPFLDIDSEWVRLRSHECLWIDVAEFERSYGKCGNRRSWELDNSMAESLHRAIEIYQGELLEGCYQDWCLCERERLQNIYLTMLHKLMSYCETRQDSETGLQIGHRILNCDRASEWTHRQMMRLHYLAGDRTSALRQFARCCDALTEELGVKPSRETTLLYEKIRDDLYEPPLIESSGNSLSTVNIAQPDPPETGDTSAGTLNLLSNLQDKLTQLQLQVAQGIKTVEAIMRSHKTSNKQH